MVAEQLGVLDRLAHHPRHRRHEAHRLLEHQVQRRQLSQHGHRQRLVAQCERLRADLVLPLRVLAEVVHERGRGDGRRVVRRHHQEDHVVDDVVVGERLAVVGAGVAQRGEQVVASRTRALPAGCGGSSPRNTLRPASPRPRRAGTGSRSSAVPARTVSTNAGSACVASPPSDDAMKILVATSSVSCFIAGYTGKPSRGRPRRHARPRPRSRPAPCSPDRRSAVNASCMIRRWYMCSSKSSSIRPRLKNGPMKYSQPCLRVRLVPVGEHLLRGVRPGRRHHLHPERAHPRDRPVRVVPLHRVVHAEPQHLHAVPQQRHPRVAGDRLEPGGGGGEVLRGHSLAISHRSSAFFSSSNGACSSVDMDYLPALRTVTASSISSAAIRGRVSSRGVRARSFTIVSAACTTTFASCSESSDVANAAGGSHSAT